MHYLANWRMQSRLRIFAHQRASRSDCRRVGYDSRPRSPVHSRRCSVRASTWRRRTAAASRSNLTTGSSHMFDGGAYVRFGDSRSYPPARRMSLSARSDIRDCPLVRLVLTQNGHSTYRASQRATGNAYIHRTTTRNAALCQADDVTRVASVRVQRYGRTRSLRYCLSWPLSSARPR